MTDRNDKSALDFQNYPPNEELKSADASSFRTKAASADCVPVGWADFVFFFALFFFALPCFPAIPAAKILPRHREGPFILQNTGIHSVLLHFIQGIPLKVETLYPPLG